MIRMDRMIRRMLLLHEPSELSHSLDWRELLELYGAMRKMLPRAYVEAMGGYATEAAPMTAARRRRRRMRRTESRRQQQQQRVVLF